MSLVDFQKLLIELYTNQGVREAFFVKPEAVLAAYDLDERERHALKTIPKEPLNLFSHSLTEKKIAVFKKLLSQKPHLFIVSPWHVSGPAIFLSEKSSKKINIVRIDNEMFSTLKIIGGPFTPGNLLRHCLKVQDFGLGQFLRMVGLVHSKRLWGKYLKLS